MATFSGNAAGYQVHYLADGRIQVVDIDASNGDTGTHIVPNDSGLTFDDRIYQVTTTTETHVNTVTVGHQSEAAVAALADGGHIVMWMSPIPLGHSSYRSTSQRYDADGNPVGGETLVGTLNSPDIAALGDGGYVIAGYDWGGVGSDTNIYAQRYDAMGNEAGAKVLVNTYTSGDQYGSKVTALADGGFLVTWTSPRQDGGATGVYAQRFDALGSKVGAEFRVNTWTARDQESPEVTALSDGGFVITWQSWGQDGDSYGVYAQRYNSAGNAIGAETRVNTTTLSSQAGPVITALADGAYLIAWSSYESGSVFYSQRYNAAGNTVGGETRVNTTPVKNGGGLDVAALAGGGHIVVWNQDFEGGSHVYAQRYDASGNAIGGEVRINAVPLLYAAQIAVTTFADGDYLITWSAAQEGSDGNEIYSRRFDADGKPISEGRFVMTGTEANDVMNGGLGDQTLLGQGGHDLLNGGAGNDELRGAGGNDTINSGVGRDTVYGGDGDDKINGGADADNLFGGAGNNVVNGAEGNDRLAGRGVLNGGAGDDALYADSGGAVLNGDEGNDNLFGSDGDDTLTGGAGNDRLEGAARKNNLDGGSGNDFLLGGGNQDQMHGGSGADVLRGGAGQDVLIGGEGNDVLAGGAGPDALTGGGGADTFSLDEYFNEFNLPGVDTITDFAVSGGDVIRLDNAIYRAFIETGVPHATKFRANAEGRAMDGDDHLVYNTATGALFYDIDGNRAIAAIQIAVLGVDTHPALTAADFLII